MQVTVYLAKRSIAKDIDEKSANNLSEELVIRRRITSSGRLQLTATLVSASSPHHAVLPARTSSTNVRYEGAKTVADAIRSFSGIDIVTDFDRIVIKQQNSSSIACESAKGLLKFLERAIGTDKLLESVVICQGAIEKFSVERQIATRDRDTVISALDKEQPIYDGALQVRKKQLQLLENFIRLHTAEIRKLHREFVVLEDKQAQLLSTQKETLQESNDVKKALELEEKRVVTVNAREAIRRRLRDAVQRRVDVAKEKLSAAVEERDHMIQRAKSDHKKATRLRKMVRYTVSFYIYSLIFTSYI
jgi:hypothetical protein